MRRELNPPEPITTHRHGPSVRRGAKASRAFVVGRGVDDFDKQIASVGAAASSSRWARVAFNRMEPQMGTPTPQFDFSLMVAPSAVLELQREERCADSIASMRDSSKATPQLFVSADGHTRAASMPRPAAHQTIIGRMSCCLAKL
jgi:hypothetical protein